MFTCISVYQRKVPTFPKDTLISEICCWERGIHMGFEHNKVLGVWCTIGVRIPNKASAFADSTEVLATPEQWQQETGKKHKYRNTQYIRDRELTEGVIRESHVH